MLWRKLDSKFPNSPDLAYPIEILWGILKERIKKRLPKNLEELIQYTVEEWYSVPQSLVENIAIIILKEFEWSYKMMEQGLKKSI